MRVRDLLLAGVGIGIVGTLIAVAVGVAVGPPDDAAMFDVPFAAGAVAALVLLAVLAFVAGWFGRERDNPVLVALGVGVAALVALFVTGIVSGGRPLSGVVLAIPFTVVAWIVVRAAFWIGDAVCDARGLPTMHRLTAPAFPTEHAGGSLWTTEAGVAIRSQLASLTETLVPGGEAEGQAVGVWIQLPRDHAVLVALADHHLGIQPISLQGDPLGDPTVLTGADLAEVSIRSETVSGEVRKQINAYDDVIEVRTTSGDRIRLRLPYGTRGAGKRAPGADAIRAWLRTSAATYR